MKDPLKEPDKNVSWEDAKLYFKAGTKMNIKTASEKLKLFLSKRGYKFDRWGGK